MEFGKLEQQELDTVNFELPGDKAETTALLSRHQKSAHPEVYVGCAKWGRKDWVGKIYPKGTKEADFLSHYAKFFNAIELNATFYRMPGKRQTAAWSSKVESDFRFCPKFSDKITHIKRLKEAQELTDRFLDGISGFGKNLGPLLLMPHPTMGPKTLETIEAFLGTIPKDFQVFIELRHKGWFEDGETFQKIFAMLETRNAGAVITDASGRRDCVHMRLTSPQAFIRFVGNGLHPSDYRRVDDWVRRIKVWLGQGLQKVFFFLHQQDEIHSPELAKYVIEQLNQHCQTNIPVPKFISEP